MAGSLTSSLRNSEICTLLLTLADDDASDDDDDDDVSAGAGDDDDAGAVGGDHTDEANSDLIVIDRLSSVVGCRWVIDSGL